MPIIAAFLVAFEIYKIKRDRLKTKAERDKRLDAIEDKIKIDGE